ncbi:MAG: hypothetical protein ABSE51_24185 [Terracidiphilus sp.]
MAGTKGRLEVWNAVNAIVRKPIDYRETSALGFDTPDDQFSVLQGDIVQTEAAYFYGERIAGMPKFAVLNSSCDLVPGRTAHASLLRILPIRKDEERAKEKLGTLLKFSRRDSMYLPALPDDTEDVVGIHDQQALHCPAANFRPSCQIALFGPFKRCTFAFIHRAQRPEIQIIGFLQLRLIVFVRGVSPCQFQENRSDPVVFDTPDDSVISI